MELSGQHNSRHNAKAMWSSLPAGQPLLAASRRLQLVNPTRPHVVYGNNPKSAAVDGHHSPTAATLAPLYAALGTQPTTGSSIFKDAASKVQQMVAAAVAAPSSAAASSLIPTLLAAVADGAVPGPEAQLAAVAVLKIVRCSPFAPTKVAEALFVGLITDHRSGMLARQAPESPNALGGGHTSAVLLIHWMLAKGLGAAQDEASSAAAMWVLAAVASWLDPWATSVSPALQLQLADKFAVTSSVLVNALKHSSINARTVAAQLLLCASQHTIATSIQPPAASSRNAPSKSSQTLHSQLPNLLEALSAGQDSNVQRLLLQTIKYIAASLPAGWGTDVTETVNLDPLGDAMLKQCSLDAAEAVCSIAATAVGQCMTAAIPVLLQHSLQHKNADISSFCVSVVCVLVEAGGAAQQAAAAEYADDLAALLKHHSNDKCGSSQAAAITVCQILSVLLDSTEGQDATTQQETIEVLLQLVFQQQQQQQDGQPSSCQRVKWPATWLAKSSSSITAAAMSVLQKMAMHRPHALAAALSKQPADIIKAMAECLASSDSSVAAAAASILEGVTADDVRGSVEAVAALAEHLPALLHCVQLGSAAAVQLVLKMSATASMDSQAVQYVEALLTAVRHSSAAVAACAAEALKNLASRDTGQQTLAGLPPHALLQLVEAMAPTANGMQNHAARDAAAAVASLASTAAGQQALLPHLKRLLEACVQQGSPPDASDIAKSATAAACAIAGSNEGMQALLQLVQGTSLAQCSQPQENPQQQQQQQKQTQNSKIHQLESCTIDSAVAQDQLHEQSEVQPGSRCQARTGCPDSRPVSGPGNQALLEAAREVLLFKLAKTGSGSRLLIDVADAECIDTVLLLLLQPRGEFSASPPTTEAAEKALEAATAAAAVAASRKGAPQYHAAVALSVAVAMLAPARQAHGPDMNMGSKAAARVLKSWAHHAPDATALSIFMVSECLGVAGLVKAMCSRCSSTALEASAAVLHLTSGSCPIAKAVLAVLAEKNLGFLLLALEQQDATGMSSQQGAAQILQRMVDAPAARAAMVAKLPTSMPTHGVSAPAAGKPSMQLQVGQMLQVVKQLKAAACMDAASCVMEAVHSIAKSSSEGCQAVLCHGDKVAAVFLADSQDLADAALGTLCTVMKGQNAAVAAASAALGTLSTVVKGQSAAVAAASCCFSEALGQPQILAKLIQYVQQGSCNAAALAASLAETPNGMKALLLPKHVAALLVALSNQQAAGGQLAECSERVLHCLARDVSSGGREVLAVQDLEPLLRGLHSPTGQTAQHCASVLRGLSLIPAGQQALVVFVGQLLQAVWRFVTAKPLNNLLAAKLVMETVGTVAAGSIEGCKAAGEHVHKVMAALGTADKGLADAAFSLLQTLTEGQSAAATAHAALGVLAQPQHVQTLVRYIKHSHPAAAVMIERVAIAPLAAKSNLHKHLQELLDAMGHHQTADDGKQGVALLLSCTLHQLTLDNKEPGSNAVAYHGKSGMDALALLDLSALVQGTLLQRASHSYHCAAVVYHVSIQPSLQAALLPHVGKLLQVVLAFKERGQERAVAEVAMDTVRMCAGHTEAGCAAVLKHMAEVLAVLQKQQQQQQSRPKLVMVACNAVFNLMHFSSGMQVLTQPNILRPLMAELVHQATQQQHVWAAKAIERLATSAAGRAAVLPSTEQLLKAVQPPNQEQHVPGGSQALLASVIINVVSKLAAGSSHGLEGVLVCVKDVAALLQSPCVPLLALEFVAEDDNDNRPHPTVIARRLVAELLATERGREVLLQQSCIDSAVDELLSFSTSADIVQQQGHVVLVVAAAVHGLAVKRAGRKVLSKPERMALLLQGLDVGNDSTGRSVAEQYGHVLLQMAEAAADKKEAPVYVGQWMTAIQQKPKLLVPISKCLDMMVSKGNKAGQVALAPHLHALEAASGRLVVMPEGQAGSNDASGCVVDGSSLLAETRWAVKGMVDFIGVMLDMLKRNLDQAELDVRQQLALLAALYKVHCEAVEVAFRTKLQFQNEAQYRAVRGALQEAAAAFRQQVVAFAIASTHCMKLRQQLQASRTQQ